MKAATTAITRTCGQRHHLPAGARRAQRATPALRDSTRQRIHRHRGSGLSATRKETATVGGSGFTCSPRKRSSAGGNYAGRAIPESLLPGLHLTPRAWRWLHQWTERTLTAPQAYANNFGTTARSVSSDGLGAQAGFDSDLSGTAPLVDAGGLGVDRHQLLLGPAHSR